MPDLTPNEVSALETLLTDLAPNLALALAEQINHELTLEMPSASAIPITELLNDPMPVAHTTFGLTQPLPEESVFAFPEETARLFVDLIEGGDGSEPALTLSEAQNQVLSQAMSGLARGLTVALTNLSGSMVELDSSATLIGPLALPPVFAQDSNAVQATLILSMPGLHASTFTFYFTPEFARALTAEEEETYSLPAADGILGDEELAAMLGSLNAESSPPGGTSLSPAAGAGYGAQAGSQSAGTTFPNFPAGSGEAMPRGLELILDIPLDVTVELGRVRMLIKDVLELATGSIVELDRVAGEPVDLLVNGRLIARGEVVVIEDNFGIRITEILSPVERVAGLGKGR